MKAPLASNLLVLSEITLFSLVSAVSWMPVSTSLTYLLQGRCSARSFVTGLPPCPAFYGVSIGLCSCQPEPLPLHTSLPSAQSKIVANCLFSLDCWLELALILFSLVSVTLRAPLHNSPFALQYRVPPLENTQCRVPWLLHLPAKRLAHWNLSQHMKCDSCSWFMVIVCIIVTHLALCRFIIVLFSVHDLCFCV